MNAGQKQKRKTPGLLSRQGPAKSETIQTRLERNETAYEIFLRERKAPVFRLEDYLFAQQLAFVRDPAPFKIAVTTRRAGKSTSCVADLVATALETPECVCLYITLSRKNAKRLVWPEFKRINKRFRLRALANESDLSLTFPNGSVVYLLGAKDRSSIEDMRGLPIKKVYLDESQSFPAYIKDLIDDVLGPALIDYAGTLCLIGTPGPVPAGYFFDLTKNKHWSNHFWSFFDNPFIALKSGKSHQEMLDRELLRRGVTVNDPSIQREWFGKWVIDRDALVFHYDDAVNNYAKLPDRRSFSYILGVDLGYDDADALALMCYHDADQTTFLVQEIITKHQGITPLTEQIDQLTKKYDIHKIVIDTAGLGKKITEEISRRYQIPMVPAEKSRKLEYIELMNDALRTGKLKALQGSRFSQDCNKVEWDLDKSTPEKKVISKRFHSDICDAVLYAWRESYSYTFKKQPAKPKPGSPEYFKEIEDKTFDHEFERLKRMEEEDPDWYGDDNE